MLDDGDPRRCWTTGTRAVLDDGRMVPGACVGGARARAPGITRAGSRSNGPASGATRCQAANVGGSAHSFVSDTTEMSARAHEPLDGSASGLSAELALPNRPASGGSKPDGRLSPVKSRHARHPLGVRSRTGRTSRPAPRAARPLRRRNAGMLAAKSRATRAFVSLLADSASTTNSPRISSVCPSGPPRETTIFSFAIPLFTYPGRELSRLTIAAHPRPAAKTPADKLWVGAMIAPQAPGRVKREDQPRHDQQRTGSEAPAPVRRSASTEASRRTIDSEIPQ